ncbi:sulfonate/nitrate transporter [Methylovirgula ligni]|uniref:NitT/TauT family transport system substrate-binding protein n=1 Tax=Methylovirgula ligni TaxID=569860 RepID=A0A3D9Z253_9HYPH|nr:ABC transporter substrate-binding protein [Methylovirgula ligni]QAY95521.1 sulfonate/nitrate transporter [Methylovirgula ligni]REF89141.1 NitT/TauT family transport system substrate-binding protein [Methylovirgula ligni]
MRARNVGAVLFVALMMLSGRASAADTVRYVLDWFPSGEETYAYVALKEGFFAEEGLDVKLSVARGSVDAITRVASGTADFTGASLGTLMAVAAQSNVPVKALMSIYSKPPDAIFTVKGSGIKSIKDLIGRSLVTGTFTSSNQLWPILAKMNGVDPAKVSLVKVDPNTIAPLLAAGKFDASINWISAAAGSGAVLKKAGKELVVLPWSEFGLKGYGFSLMASDEIIKERPDVVRRFVRAFYKAVLFNLKNPDQAAKDLGSIVAGIDVASAAGDVRSTIPLIKNEVSAEYGVGTFDPALVKTTWEWIAKTRGYPLDKLDPNTVINRSFFIANHG